ncbi:uncharacterized protein HD556DRAFT_1452690 [Suillus plorans]|uniref:Survival Motor Neuron Gemin2-binding domain-containing protein n=1 Tax=Suillus plorans TaxID=116603 RepID=A0A9P7E2Y4_9AGAM|nr:uncharacterized protein HD556DRAFT_1452690 [Suillus plorans]KAG1809954.1 hypothetical protein HD556DRAFT_1452690 [Suillus plorans]
MNSHRQLVQYGDLEQSQQTNGASSSAVASESRSRQSPPSKKRKRSNQKAKRPRKTAHWDEPGDNQMNYDDASAHGEDGEVEEGESRELTHQEIWDDSALIDAWNSATAEYEAFHGETQDWKSTAVKKSSLWYNVPYNSSKEKAKTPNLMKAASAEAISQAATAEEEDSAPLDFNTFVPSYDPSLPVPFEAPAAPESSFFIPAPSTTMVSRDEAFSRALSAMYWGGYWTAVYHCQNQQPSQEAVEEQDHQEYEDDEEALEDDTEDLVPTQR